MRTPVAITPEGYAVCAGSVPQGQSVRFTHATKAKILEAVNRAVGETQLKQTPDCLFVFSCTTRRQFLGTSVDQELDPASKKYPGVPMIGFYCYGEFSPYRGKKRTVMHNNTLCVVAIAA